MENLMKNYITNKWPLPVFLVLIFTVVGIVNAQESRHRGRRQMLRTLDGLHQRTDRKNRDQDHTTEAEWHRHYRPFQGPDWSGGLEGTINEQHIVFRTKSRFPMVYRGRVQGDTIQGTFHVRIGTGGMASPTVELTQAIKQKEGYDHD